ncbi:uncharacterized protein EI97DRAFT_499366 [Westerdykella ornata]|uniref:Uncharacterized protein n=1 Tax=Westerdykella ornata TaxID=318751 RepID=A0A6A6JRB3_WESOR|nr:uncharacterized protein EI97DRAFT_499366 [Westerdykella ornata]KAF2278805.1 hypothetical protein EI97DRAFT_499366 [Westerdykella ornata]
MGFTSFMNSLSCTNTCLPKTTPSSLPSPLPSPAPQSPSPRSSTASSTPLLTKAPIPTSFRPKSLLSPRPLVVPLATSSNHAHGLFCRTKTAIKTAIRETFHMDPTPRPLPDPPRKFTAPGRCADGQHKWRHGRCKRCLMRECEGRDRVGLMTGGMYCGADGCRCRSHTDHSDGGANGVEDEAPQIDDIVITPSLTSQLAANRAFYPAGPPLAHESGFFDCNAFTIHPAGSSIADLSDDGSVQSLRVPRMRMPRSRGYMDLRLALDNSAATMVTVQAEPALPHRRRSERSSAPEPSTRPSTNPVQQEDAEYFRPLPGLRRRESRSAAPEPSTRSASLQQASQNPSRDGSPREERQQREESRASSWTSVSSYEDWRLWIE